MSLKLQEVTLAKGKMLYVVGSVNGVRVNRSTGFAANQRKLARAKMLEIETSILRGEDQQANLGPTIGEGLKLYLNRPGGVGVTTRKYVEAFAAKFKKTPVAQVMPMDVIRFVGTANKGLSTIRRETNAIQGFLNFLREGLMLSPLRIRKPDEADPKNTRFTEAERDHMLAVCQEEEPWFAPHLTALFYTGARRSEICRLLWRDITFQGGEPVKIVFRSKKGKKAKERERHVPVHPVLVPYIKALRMLRKPKPDQHVFLTSTGQPLHTPASINKAFDKVLAKAELEHLTPHDARRTFASGLLEKDVPELVITDMLGHIDKRMLKVYAVVDDDLRRRSVEKISSPVGG